VIDRGRFRWLWAAAAGVITMLVIVSVVRPVVVGRHGATRSVQQAPAKLRKAHWFRLSLELRLVAADGTVRTTTAKASIDAGSDRVAATVPAVLGRPDLELIAQGPITYLSIPVDHRHAFGDARYIRVDARNAEAAGGARIGPLPGPVAFLDALTAVTSPVRGVPGPVAPGETRQRVRIDLLHLPHTPEGAELFNALIPLGRRFDADVTLDGKKRLKNLSASVPLRDGQRLEVRLTSDAVGEEVIIGVPPDSATVPAATLHEALTMVGASPP
jgi:hypothetical protein